AVHMQPDRLVRIPVPAPLRGIAREDAAFEPAFLLQLQAGLLHPIGTDESLAARAAELQQYDDPIVAAFLGSVVSAFREIGDFAAFDEQAFRDRDAAFQAEADLVPGMTMPR